MSIAVRATYYERNQRRDGHCMLDSHRKHRNGHHMHEPIEVEM